MRCKAFSTCHKCNNDILWIDYEEYGATEIIIDNKCVDLCGCCYHDLIKSHVDDCLNDIVHNLTNDTSFCEQKCSTNSSFL